MENDSGLRKVLLRAPILGIFLFGSLTFINVLFGDSLQKSLTTAAMAALFYVILWIPFFLIYNFFRKKKKGASNTKRNPNKQ